MSPLSSRGRRRSGRSAWAWRGRCGEVVWVLADVVRGGGVGEKLLLGGEPGRGERRGRGGQAEVGEDLGDHGGAVITDCIYPS
jgi:hypothetical protein